VSDQGISISAVSAAGAHVPVRPIDPVRRRFPTAEEAGQSGVETFSQFGSEDESSASRAQDGRGRAARGGFGSLIGAATSFFASLFSQPEAEAARASQSASAMQAASAAYARTASAPAVQAASYEVLSPSLPRLSSGRAFDLSV